MPSRTDIPNRPADPLVLDGLSIRPETHLVHSVVVLAQITSTNDVCRGLAEGGVLPVAVIADYQTAGRGRLGRTWSAPPGTALLFSLSIPHDCLPCGLPGLGTATALALVDAIRDSAGLSAGTKWPNDVLLSGRKAAGILIENYSRFVVVGVGMNVWQTREHFPPELRDHATSIAAEGGRLAGRMVLLDAVLRRLCWRLRQPTELLLRDRRAVELTLGRRLIVQDGGRGLRGIGAALDTDGSLLIRLEDGTMHRLRAGDVSVQLE